MCPLQASRSIPQGSVFPSNGYSQPSLGYGLLLSLRANCLTWTLSARKLPLLNYSLPFIQAIVFLTIFNHLLSSSLFHLAICFSFSCKYSLSLDLLFVMALFKFHKVIAFISTISHLLSHAGWINLHAYGLMTLSCQASKLSFFLYFNDIWLIYTLLFLWRLLLFALASYPYYSLQVSN